MPELQLTRATLDRLAARSLADGGLPAGPAWSFTAVEVEGEIYDRLQAQRRPGETDDELINRMLSDQEGPETL